MAQQSGGAAVAAGAGSGREAVAAIADQESAGLAVGVRRGPIGAVADQRTFNSARVGALMTSNSGCKGPKLVASAAAYACAPPDRACTNWL
ncbi:Uncharacterised protein [Mycobacterium tuberculosis]|nr:Uncharacterised protein [Mycobacterium tuberculosis]CMO00353.1 Uncharacterised protein [Mycobacterium tuberculosis]